MLKDASQTEEVSLYSLATCITGPQIIQSGSHSYNKALFYVVFKMLAESLCAILLLEESSPRQVFTEFILARKATLQEIFHPCQHGKILL